MQRPVEAQEARYEEQVLDFRVKLAVILSGALFLAAGIGALMVEVGL